MTEIFQASDKLSTNQDRTADNINFGTRSTSLRDISAATFSSIQVAQKTIDKEFGSLQLDDKKQGNSVKLNGDHAKELVQEKGDSQTPAKMYHDFLLRYEKQQELLLGTHSIERNANKEKHSATAETSK